VSPTAEPESTRIPARAALVVNGAATVLLRARAVIVLLEPRTIGKMPGPSVPITLLPEISVEWVPAPTAPGSSVPTAMPAQPTALFALMKLLLTVVVRFTGPSACSSIAMQSMFRSRFQRRPVTRYVVVTLPGPVDPAGEDRSGWLPIPPLPPFIRLPVTLITLVACPAVP
jgi:hypothetical protein